MVAARAGVGAGTIYRYFKSKDVLIADLYCELEEELLLALGKGYINKMPIRERILHLTTVLLKYMVANPAKYRFIEQYFNSPYGVNMSKERLLGKLDNQSIFKSLFGEGISKGVLKDLPLSLHFALAFGPIFTLTRDSVLGFIILDDALILKTSEACWEAIKR